MLTDLTFSNAMILDYFKGDNSYVPTSELIYLHEHPLIRDSFLVEIEKMIHETSEVIVKKNINGNIVENFIQAAIKIGAALPTINQQNAPNILEQLRVVYKLCKHLLN
jgi:hypothetical protein